MDLLSLLPDRYLLQPNKFVLCTPLPAEGNVESISSYLQIAEELLCGVITWSSFFHRVGDRSKQGGHKALSHRYVDWWLPHVTGLQSLLWFCCSLLLTYLLGNSFPCRKVGCDFGSAVCCGGLWQEPHDAYEEALPTVTALSRLIWGYPHSSCSTAETATLNQKLMKGKNESGHLYSLPHLFVQCKYFMSTNRWMLGMTLFTPSSSYLSVNHQTARWRAIYAEQILCPMDAKG